MNGETYTYVAGIAIPVSVLNEFTGGSVLLKFFLPSIIMDVDKTNIMASLRVEGVEDQNKVWGMLRDSSESLGRSLSSVAHVMGQYARTNGTSVSGNPTSADAMKHLERVDRISKVNNAAFETDASSYAINYETHAGTNEDADHLINAASYFAAKADATFGDMSYVFENTMSAARKSNMSGSDLMAIASTMLNFTGNKEMTSEAINTILGQGGMFDEKGMASLSMLGYKGNEFKDMFANDASQALLDLSERIMNQKPEKRPEIIGGLFSNMKKESLNAIDALLINPKLLKENLAISSDKQQYSGYTEERYTKINKTVLDPFIELDRKLTDIGNTLSKLLLPVVTDFVTGLEFVVNVLGSLAGQFPGITHAFLTAAVSLMAIHGVASVGRVGKKWVGGGVDVISSMWKKQEPVGNMGKMKNIPYRNMTGMGLGYSQLNPISNSSIQNVGKMRTALGAVGRAFMFLKNLFMSSPFGWLLLLVGIVYKFWQPINVILKGLWKGITKTMDKFSGFIEPIKPALTWLGDAFSWITEQIDGLFTPLNMTSDGLNELAYWSEVVGEVIGAVFSVLIGVITTVGKAIGAVAGWIFGPKSEESPIDVFTSWFGETNDGAIKKINKSESFPLPPKPVAMGTSRTAPEGAQSPSKPLPGDVGKSYTSTGPVVQSAASDSTSKAVQSATGESNNSTSTVVQSATGKSGKDGLNRGQQVTNNKIAYPVPGASNGRANENKASTGSPVNQTFNISVQGWIGMDEKKLAALIKKEVMMAGQCISGNNKEPLFDAQ